MMALKTGAKILPIYTAGNYSFFTRTKAVIGEIIDLNEYTGNKHNPSAVTQATEYLRTRMIMMRNMVQDGNNI